MADQNDHDPVRPSTVRLPPTRPLGVTTLLDFVVARFPRVPRVAWEARFAAGEVWTVAGPLAADAPFEPLLEVHYRRAVATEPPVRTDFRIVWQSRDLLVVDKPPFLPVIPGGLWVRHTLLHLLGDHELVPLHRLDRLTSGLVVLSRRPASRGHFARLFQPNAPVVKTYSSVCHLPTDREPPRAARLADHVTRSTTEYWRQEVVTGQPVNSRCALSLAGRRGSLVLYRLRPVTGRKHQLRVQLAHAGLPIVGDPLYGLEQRHDPRDVTRRMWLDAHQLEVRGFPLPDGGVLDARWRSSRSPESLLRRAALEAVAEQPGAASSC